MQLTLGFLRRNLYFCPPDVKEAAYKLEAICTGDATTIPLSEKLPVRCRVKIQVNEAMIQIIIGRYKKKNDKPNIFLRFYIVRRLWKIEINIRIASQIIAVVLFATI